MALRRSIYAACAIALLLAPYPVAAQVIDLDRLDDARLERDILAELDDIYEDLDEDAEYSLSELKEEMLDALGDDGDSEDEEEISLEALEQEMAEADTTLERVIDEALMAADAVAGGDAPSAFGIVRVAGASAVAAQRRGNGRTTPRQAVLQGTRAIVRTSSAR